MLDAPILTVKCMEPEGEVERSVYRLVFTPQNLQKFWDSAKQFSTIYGKEINNVKDFVDMFISYDVNGNEMLDGLFFYIPDGDKFIGVFYLTNINGLEADVHYSFFDKRHRGRVPLVKAMIKYVFDTYGFRRLNATVPLYTTKFVRHFITNIGFTMEGKKRSAAKYKGQWYNVNLYGMLYNEISEPALIKEEAPLTTIDEVTPDGNGSED